MAACRSFNKFSFGTVLILVLLVLVPQVLGGVLAVLRGRRQRQLPPNCQRLLWRRRRLVGLPRQHGFLHRGRGQRLAHAALRSREPGRLVV